MIVIAVPLYWGGQREFLNLLFYYLSSKFIFFVIIIFVKGKVILSFFYRDPTVLSAVSCVHSGI